MPKLISKYLMQQAFEIFDLHNLSLLVDGSAGCERIDLSALIRACKTDFIDVNAVNIQICTELFDVDGALILYANYSPVLGKKWRNELRTWLLHNDKNCVVIFGSNDSITSWINYLIPQQTPITGPGMAGINSIMISGNLIVDDPTLSFFMGGGLGDIVHHYMKSDAFLTAKALKEFNPNIKIKLFLSTVNDEVERYLYETPYIDHIVRYDNDETWHPATIDIDMLTYAKQIGIIPVDNMELHYNICVRPELDDVIVIHPFVSMSNKIFVDDVWWMNFIDVLLDADYKVCVVGCPSDENAPLMDEFWAYLKTKTHINFYDLTDAESFANKIGMLQYARAFITGDSCWMHVAQALKKPGVVLIDGAFYSHVLTYMESNAYDFNWHPYTRAMFQYAQNEMVVPENNDIFGTIFGNKFTTTCAPAHVITLLERKMDVYTHKTEKV